MTLLCSETSGWNTLIECHCRAIYLKNTETKIMVSRFKYTAIRVYRGIEVKVNAFLILATGGSERLASVYLLPKQLLFLLVCKKLTVYRLMFFGLPYMAAQ
jgi:hypothetical protein